MRAVGVLDAYLASLMQIDLYLVALAGTAAFATSILTGLSGFGGGFLLSIIISPVVGVQAVVPVMAVVNLLANITRVFVFWESLDVSALRTILVTAIPGVIIGAFIYAHLPAETIAVYLGVFIIASVPIRRLMARRRIRVDGRGLAIAGFGYGLLNAVTMGARMLLVPVLLGAGLYSQVQLATAAAVTIALNTLKMIVFSGFGLLSPSMLLAGCLMGLCTIPGTYLARWIIRRMEVQIHTVVMELLLIMGGLYFVWRGIALT